jgi:sugar phosphate isomerase/epimerase
LDELRSPWLRIVFDGANLFEAATVIRMRAILDEAFELLGGDLALMHAKELSADGHAGNLPLGAGVLDWDHYLAGVRQARFAGPVILHGIGEKDVEASLAFLRQRVAAAEWET